MKKIAALIVMAATIIPARAFADVKDTQVTVPDSVKGPSVSQLITNVTNILAFIAGAAAVIAIIIGGIMYITSAGDEKRVEAAKNTILYAVVGMVVAILAFAIATFVVAGISKTS